MPPTRPYATAEPPTHASETTKCVLRSGKIRIDSSPLSQLVSGDEEQIGDGTFSSDRLEYHPKPRAAPYSRGLVSAKRGQDGLETCSPALQSAPKKIIVKGKQLQPTIVFDTFWRFAAERKSIDDRRRSGQPAPWTDDPILQKYAFCNTYRVLDKVSQYIIREVIEKGSQEPAEIVFRVTLFNIFTKIQTWEHLDQELGPLTWSSYDRKKYQAAIASAKRDGAIYTGAFQKPAPNFGFSDNYMNHLCLLEAFMENDMPDKLLEADYMADVFEYLVSFPSMGEFSTYQLMLNLQYSCILDFSGMDFVVPGPGSSSGLLKMFGSSMARAKASCPGFEVDVMRWLAKNQVENFVRLGLKFSGLGPKHLPMDLADIEHTLSRELRRSYVLSDYPYPAVPTIPKAWSSPARKTIRIRPGGPPIIEKRYTVNRIGGRRQGPDGVQYLVYWYGYADDEATWEFEQSLLDDAPTVVEEYLATIKPQG
ncbi:hypothetical protein BD779DRAFT_1516396 [Infundibulicybe gibba]|nr:hypothetical protein BD779DRAFT_1516396 [Infundibulicybe gibba]